MISSNKKSLIVVIDGLDGSGKATQTKIIADKLKSRGLNVKHLDFPNYDSSSSSLVKMYLNGDFGSKPDDVNAYAASAFYAVDRVASYLQYWKKDYEAGTIFLCDRYATSNVIYQLTKVDKNDWDSFIEWHSDFEYSKLGIPEPDVVIYLDVEPEVSQRLMRKRYAGDASKMDLHEKNVQFLLDCRKSALYVSEKCNWNVINCCKNNNIRSIDSIADDIEKTVLKYL